MPWVKENGKTVRVRIGLSAPEVTIRDDTPDPDLYLCPECGREYKTETGRDNHLADKH